MLKAKKQTWRELGDAVTLTGESPFWDPVRRAVLSVDIRGERILETNWDNGNARIFPVEGLPAFIAPLTDGTLAVATRHGIRGLSRTTGRCIEMLVPAWFADHLRLNDGTIDPAGRLLIGTMAMNGALEGQLFAIERGQPPVALIDDIGIVNGLAISPDGLWLYISDSHPDRNCVWRYRYDCAGPTVCDRTLFADFKRLGIAGAPDGAAMDVDGGYWIAALGGSALIGFDRDGRIAHHIALPFSEPSKLAFAGPDMTEVAVTSFSRGDQSAPAGTLIAVSMPSVGAPLQTLAW